MQRMQTMLFGNPWVDLRGDPRPPHLCKVANLSFSLLAPVGGCATPPPPRPSVASSLSFPGFPLREPPVGDLQFGRVGWRPGAPDGAGLPQAVPVGPLHLPSRSGPPASPCLGDPTPVAVCTEASVAFLFPRCARGIAALRGAVPRLLCWELLIREVPKHLDHPISPCPRPFASLKRGPSGFRKCNVFLMVSADPPPPLKK